MGKALKLKNEIYLDEKSIKIGKILYDNSSGSDGTITLNDSTANYEYIEIFYKNIDGNTYSSVKINKPNGKLATLTASDYSGSTYGIYIYSARAIIEANKITLTRCGWQYIGYDRYCNGYGQLRITRVIGYNYFTK